MAIRKLEDVYPLSPLQEGILFHSLYSPESGLYVEQLSCALDGPLDVGAFARAWERVIERHAILRTSFVWKSQKRPLQAVHRNVELPLAHEDWSALPAAERERRFAAFLAADRRQGFELARAPLLRLVLVRFGAESHRLVWTSHHLLLDGWSLPLVLSEVLRFYAAFATGRELDLLVPRPYRDYIAWVEGQDLAVAEEFFRRELAGFTEPTEIDLPRPVLFLTAPDEGAPGRAGEPAPTEGSSEQTVPAEPEERTLALGAAAHARLAEAARRHRLTLSTLVLGAWAALLGRYRGDRTGMDVLFGETVSGRGIPLPGIESMIGLFINTLPVRAQLAPGAAVGDWLAGLQERQLALQDFEATPLARIQGWSEVAPGTPLLATLFVFENYPTVPLAPSEGLTLSGLRFREQTNYALTAVAAPAGEELTLRLAGDPVRYDGATVARLLGHWGHLLAALGEGLDSAAALLGDLAMLSPPERQQLVTEWNPSRPKLSRFCLHERFAALAARSPDAVALTVPREDGAIGSELSDVTYGELAARARRLAAALRRRGVGPESLVAVCLERSPELVVALLAVLEAGGAYLPLDPAYPPERLGFMLADSGARVLVSRPDLASRLPPHQVELMSLVTPEETAESPRDECDGRDERDGAVPENLAYVIYTSGSTGRPKGVAVTHANLSRLLAATAPVLDPGPDDVWTLFHSHAFDFSVWEMWGALAHGGRLVIVPVALGRSPADFLALLADERVTVLNQTPPGFGQLAPVALADPGARGELPALRLIMLGGEALDPALLAPWIERHGEERPRLVNLYGPTEGTVLVTARRLGRADLGQPGSPLGRPLADLRIHLLDDRPGCAGKLAPLGAAGEIAVGGAGLARGYLGRPGLSAERFRPDPFAAEPGARLYFTGDLGRRRPDGELEFLGRADRQVKIRGFRIELGEIEAALATHPGVRAAAVEVRSRGGRADVPSTSEIVAYVAAGAEVTAAELRAHLARTLPEPMLPAVFVRRAALPLLPSGKIDRRALRALSATTTAGEGEERAGAAEAVAPRGPVEELLAGLWAEVLRVPEVGIDDNFFALGGDSILSLQVVARAGQAGCRITPRQLFEHPTVAGLAAVAEWDGATGPAKTVAAPQEAVTGDVPLTPIQRWFFAQEAADPHHFNQALLLAVRPSQGAALAPDTLARAVAALLVHHDALRLRFRREGGSWRQWSAAPEAGAPPFAQIDLSALPAASARMLVTVIAAAAQGSLDLAAGPLLRSLWLDLPAGEARLFLAVHHLAVDAVSWRLILEDLATACRQLGGGETVRLPLKTTAFRRWAERLVERAREMAIEPELSFWSAQRSPAGGQLPAFAGLTDRGDVEDTVGGAASVVVELPAKETGDLLRALPAAYGAALADGLIAALAAALAGPGGSVQIDLEGHGREDLAGTAVAVDLSRTVGWFTSLFPLLLSPGENPHPGAVLAAIRAQLAAVPSRRLGYGLLRYLSDELGVAAAALRDLPPSAVSFNYLGQLDATLGGGSPFVPAAEPVGPSQSPRARRSHALVVGAAVAGGRLQVSWGYGASRFDEAAVRRLAERFLARLRELAAHARGVAAGREERVGPDLLAEVAEVPADSPADSSAPFAAVDPAALACLPTGLEDAYPLAPLQEGLLFHSLYAPGAGEYVEQLRATFEGNLDLAAFREAWRRLVAATPILRTSFHGDGLERPLQAVHRQVEVEIVEEDWRGRAEAGADLERRFAELVRADRARGFDLARPPLMRWTLIRTAERGWRFLWSHHHALLDGWSYSALIGDFAACYEALAAGREPVLRTRPPYRDFIAWLSRRDEAADDAFFRGYLAGFGTGFDTGSPAPTPLAADRSAASALAPAEVSLALAPAETAALQAAARSRGLTLNTLAQAAWALLLGRTAGADDVVFGTTVSGRPPELPGAEAMLGLFINTLPVRVRLEEEAPVAAWLAGLQTAQAALRQHEAAPLVRIQGASPVPRGTALFETLLVFENYPQEAAVRASALGRQITAIEAIEQTHYPLSLAVVPGAPAPGGLLLALGYDRARFDASTALRRLGQLRNLFAEMIAALASKEKEGLATVGRLSLLSAPERQQLVHEWNRPVAPLAGAGFEETIGALWARQVARTPGAVALDAPEGCWTYAELDRLARRLATELRRAGAGPEVPVAVVADRSAALVWSFLAIEIAGAVYLPLDPAQPAARLAYQLADAAAPLIVTAEPWAALAVELAGGLTAGRSSRILRADLAAVEALPEPRLDEPAVQPGHLAYVLYTSGSTGEPKGVATSNGVLAAHLLGAAEPWSTGGERLPLFSSPGFDVSIEELLVPWTAGGAVVVPGPDLREPARVLAEVARGELTVLCLPTAFWHVWVNELAAGEPFEPPASLRAVLIGGETMPVEAARRWLSSPLAAVPLFNGYGPTEAVVTTTWRRVDRAAVERGDAIGSPIGTPLAGRAAYVLDRRCGLLPAGAPGELHLGDPFLARGYLGRPDLTAASFVPDPFAASPGGRLYRTGDLVRRAADGDLEFLGRVDDQVKVRGVRVELAEVEAALQAAPEVGEAAVVAPAGPAGERTLVAFYTVATVSGVASPAADRSAVLRAAMARRLPAAMIPALVELAALPLTANGKVDRRALLDLSAGLDELPGVAATRPPRGPTEELLANLWAGVLGRAAVGAEDDFFRLGGHSLLATQVVSRVRRDFAVELPLRALFERPTVAALAAEIDRLRAGAVAPALSLPIVPIPRDRPLPLSFAQRRLWFLDQMDRGSAAYNMPLAVALSGRLDRCALARSLEEIVRRHESLRTRFATAAGGEPVQVIAPAGGFTLPAVDLSALGERAEGEAARLAAADALRPFDLERGPLFRPLLLSLGAAEHVFLGSMHHIVSDGWSMGVLVAELGTLYAAQAAGRPSSSAHLPELPIQYADFASWQREELAGEAMSAEVDHWRERLAGMPPRLELPTDRPRPTVASLRGATLPFRLATAAAESVRALARSQGATAFMVLLAAWEVVLGRHAGQQDFAVGTPTAGRTRLELEGLIGFFVNTLALRANLAGDPPFAALLGAVRQETLDAFAHQELPFEKLVEELAPERSLASTPLFQVMLVLQNTPLAALETPGLLLSPMPMANGAAKFELTLALAEEEAGFAGTLEHRGELFDRATVKRLVGQLENLLVAAGQEPERRLAELTLLSAAESQQLLREWNDIAAGERREETCVSDLFAVQAAGRPDAVALSSEDETVTYGELDRRAERLASRLARLGVGPEVVVGLCLDRSVAMVMATLAVLKSGGAYLPLDPAAPPVRLAFLLRDAGASVLVTEESLLGRFEADRLPGLGILCLDSRDSSAVEEAPRRIEGMRSAVFPDQLAYVMYTSGSTGVPKGVAVPHRAIVRLVDGGFAALGPGEVLLQLAPASFDAATFEIWGALATGARLVVAPPGALSPEEIGGLLERHGVTTLWLTAGLFQQVIESVPERLSSLSQLLAGGDVLSPGHVRRALAAGGSRLSLINGYGPTENTTFTCTHAMASGAELAGPVPLGRPLAGTRVYLLGAAGEEVPLGAPGELCAGGAGLARGYAGRPELTAERFVPAPAGLLEAPGARLYRTGDLARALPDGRLEYLGRLDRQVKIRGFRIEPAEIEAVLGGHPRVREAAVQVCASPTGDKRLVAYFTPAGDPAPAAEELRAFLAERLPAYMVPAHWVPLAELPLTANGKLDRAALPAPETKPGGDDYLAPRNPIEEVLAGIWEEVLQRGRISIEDDFFRLGGHSLLATQVTSRIRRTLGVELPLRTFFAGPSIASLAVEVERLRQTGELAAVPPLAPAPRNEDPPMSFSQERMWLFEQLAPGTGLYNVPRALGLHGRLTVPVLAAALREVVRRHEVLRSGFVAAFGRPVQRVDPAWRPSLPVVDLAGLPAAPRAEELDLLAAAAAAEPFDLARGRLLRSTLVRIAEDDHVLLLTLHHLVCDGWSMGLLVQELASLYAAGVRGEPSPLPELAVQYADFAVWQRGWLAGEVLARELRHATAELAGLPALELPTDRPPAVARLFSSGILPLVLAAPLTANLQALARRQGVSLFMALLAGLQALLHRHTGQDDFAIGAPVAGRNRAELEPLIGFFINTLVLRTTAGGNPGFAELLERSRATTLTAYDHQDLPLSKVEEALRSERQSAPLLQVRFLWHNQPRPAIALPGVAVELLQREVADSHTNFALSFELFEAGGRVVGTLAFNRSLFDAATALRFRDHLAILLAAAAEDPARRLAELPLLAESERHQVLVEWSADGETVLLGRDPASIGTWGEVWKAAPDGKAWPTGRRSRWRADGTLDAGRPAAESSLQAPAAGAQAEIVTKRLDAQERRLEQLSPAKRKLLERRLRGAAGAPVGAVPAGGARRVASSLLVELQPRLPASAGRPAFFCVHAIGGSVLAYRELARRLGPEQPFYGIQAAGLTGGPAVDALPAMAAAYAAAVEAAAPEGPYLLGGWSFGGLVAFEMACQLRARGRQVALVALLDSWAPALAPLPELPGEAEVVRLFLRDQAGLQDLQGRDAAWLDAEPPGLDEAAAVDWLLGRSREAGLLKAGLSFEQVRPLLDVYRANVRAGAAYRPLVYADRLTLFRPLSSAHPTNGWDALTAEPVEVYELAANHYTLLAPPAVAVLAERLGSAIERELDRARSAPAEPQLSELGFPR